MKLHSEVIRGCLQDELERGARMLDACLEKQKSEIEGNLAVRHLKTGDYFYLVSYNGGKRKLVRLGRCGECDVSDVQKQIRERESNKETIKRLKLEQKDLKKILEI